MDALFQASMQTIRMTPGDAPKASIIDFVMAVTGKNNNDAGTAIRRLKTNDIMSFVDVQKFQFPGVGQKPQFVLSAKECVEVAMVLPGKNATQFRSSAASIVTRVFAGDPTLHDLIDKNGLSQSAIQQFARSNVETEALTNDENVEDEDMDDEDYTGIEEQGCTEIQVERYQPMQRQYVTDPAEIVKHSEREHVYRMAELARQTATENAESKRKDAESRRQDTDSKRVWDAGQAEAKRKDTASKRVWDAGQAEAKRKDTESKRIWDAGQAEAKRKDTESRRVWDTGVAERKENSKRKDAEEKRKDAEEKRKDAEEKRKDAEEMRNESRQLQKQKMEKLSFVLEQTVDPTKKQALIDNFSDDTTSMVPIEMKKEVPEVVARPQKKKKTAEEVNEEKQLMYEHKKLAENHDTGISTCTEVRMWGKKAALPDMLALVTGASLAAAKKRIKQALISRKNRLQDISGSIEHVDVPYEDPMMIVDFEHFRSILTQFCTPNYKLPYVYWAYLFLKIWGDTPDNRECVRINHLVYGPEGQFDHVKLTQLKT